MEKITCASEIRAGVWNPVRCSRVAGYGPDGKFCKQHAPKVATGEHLWVALGKWRDSEFIVTIHPIPILYETAAIIRLEPVSAGGYKGQVHKDSLVSLGLGRTPEEALELARAKARVECEKAVRVASMLVAESKWYDAAYPQKIV